MMQYTTIYGHEWLMVEKSLTRSQNALVTLLFLFRINLQPSTVTSSSQGLKIFTFFRSCIRKVTEFVGCNIVKATLRSICFVLVLLSRQLSISTHDLLRDSHTIFVIRKIPPFYKNIYFNHN